MRRICPSEEILSEYISGVLAEEDRTEVEKHLAGCAACRELLVETHDIISRPDIHEIKNRISRWIRKNQWLIGAAAAFTLSFVFSEHFLQFLTACIIMGAKWAVDAKTAKMLIMIYEAWKCGDRDKADKILSRIDGTEH